MVGKDTETSYEPPELTEYGPVETLTEQLYDIIGDTTE